MLHMAAVAAISVVSYFVAPELDTWRLWVEQIEAVGAGNCLELRLPHNFTQASAPEDISEVKKLIFAEVNKRVDGLLSLTIEYNGDDIHGRRVGWHRVHGTIEHHSSPAAALADPSSGLAARARRALAQSAEGWGAGRKPTKKTSGADATRVGKIAPAPRVNNDRTKAPRR